MLVITVSNAFTLQKMELLYNSARTIAENKDINSTIHSIIEYLESITHFQCGTLGIKKSDSIQLYSSKDEQWKTDVSPAINRVIRLSTPFIQAAFSGEKLVNLPLGMTLIIVPVIYRNQTEGALAVLKQSVADRDELELFTQFLTTLAELISGTLLERIHSESSFTTLQTENAELRSALLQLEERGRSDSIIGETDSMRLLFREIAQVAPSDTTALIRGETGTGKELIAHAIHEKSSCSDGPFIAVNCGALTDSLLESELFGYEKGSFTGAQQSRKGKFEEAHGGTLFLDEIGELSLDAQTKLLRVLQEKEVVRVGGSNAIKISVRIICATNRDLEEALQNKQFREDLYFRINVFAIVVPSLAQRKDDIPLLVKHFLSINTHSYHSHSFEISPQVDRILKHYPWPGNVRELRNVIERATLVTTDGMINPEHLPPHLIPEAEKVRNAESFEGQVAQFETEIIESALKQSNGNQTKTADLLHTTKRVIQYKIDKLNIDYRQFKKQ